MARSKAEDILRGVVVLHKNLVIVGQTGAGKTTLKDFILRGLSGVLDESYVVIDELRTGGELDLNGNRNYIATLHSDTLERVPTRLENLGLPSGTFDYGVMIERKEDGARVITGIVEYKNDTVDYLYINN